jgi:catechol 2,3-dioxygenase-like lactoylglutathione lyase family enzyme
MFKINSIDHIVLTVKDIERTIHFYETILGMKKIIFGDNRIALKFGKQKINLHKYKHEVEPKATHPMPGSTDICLIIQTDLNEAMTYVKNHGVKIIDGPVKRTGAQGDIISFYMNDPDGNLIEIANYL